MKTLNLVLLAFLLLPVVSAEQHNWRVDNRFGTNIELSVDHTFPDGEIPLGSTFSVSTVAWTANNGIDALAYDSITYTDGCELIFSNVDVTTGPADSAITSEAVFRIIGPSCSWSRNVTASDTVLGEIARVNALGTVVASSTAPGSFGFGGLEILAFVGLAFVGVQFWSRSGDGVVQLVGCVVILAAGLAFWGSPQSAWSLGKALGLILMVFSGYLVVRWAADILKGSG